MIDDTKYLFLDSMIYLHFRAIEEIRWTELLDCGHVKIILPRITIRELDKHKATHSSNKVRDRARRNLKKFEEKLNSGDTSIRNDAELTFLDILPSIDYASFGLNPDWSDDVLLASTLYFKQENSNYDVVLVTEDTGARIKARSLGITTFELPEEFRLQSEPDPLLEENRKLRERLIKLSAAMPSLVVQFSDGENFRKFTYSKTSEESEEVRADRIAKEVAIGKEKHQWQPPLQIASFLSPSKGEIERYRQDLKEFLKKYEQYLNHLADWQFYQTRIFPFKVELMNDGTFPADDIDILLHFPDGFLLREEDDLRPEPSSPTKPVHPRSRMELMQGLGRSFDYLQRPFNIPDFTRISREPPNVSGPRIRRTKSFEVEFHVRRLKHGFSVELETLFLDFSESTEVKSFNIQYTINAANMPENVEGELHVIFEPETQE